MESIYALIYMDAVFLKMRLEGHVRNVALYTIIGINLDGQKECLGLWISETIEAVFPRAEVQKRIVHQIRNSLRYVSWKERKPMAKDLRRIYEAATEVDLTPQGLGYDIHPADDLFWRPIG